MLDFLRRSATSFFAWIILGVLVLVFGLSFGLPSDSLSFGSKPLVRVHGEPVSDDDYRLQFNLIRLGFAVPKDERFQQLMGLKEEVLEAVVERELLAHTAEKLGLAATKTDAEDLVLAGHVVVLGETKDWLGDLSFNYDLFKNSLLRSLQTTEQKYLETQRRELLARTLRDLVASSVAVSEQELRQAYEAEANELDLRYVQFDADTFGALVDPTPEQLDAYVAEHREELLSQLGQQGPRFTKLPKQARLYVLELPKAESAVAKRALARISGGEDFRKVARELSRHETAARGGDYGWVSINSPTGLDPAADAALQGLEEGATSGIVEGEDALYILHNAGMREGDVPEDEALRELAEEGVRTAKGRELAQRAAEEALAAVTGGQSLDDVFGDASNAEAAARPAVQKTGMFSRNEPIPGLGTAPALVEAAWTADPKQPLIEQVFEVGDSYVLAGLEDKREATDEGFAEARTDLYAQLLERKAALVNARWAMRQCLEAKAEGDISANEAKIASVVAYEDAQAALKPYSVCDRVGNRGGLLRAGLGGAGAP